MSQIYWHTTGSGNSDLVLLHGWGLNAEVWYFIITLLSMEFRLHLVDLPGFGRSQKCGVLTLDEMVEILFPQLPEKTALLGWSLGGLVASRMSLCYPHKITHLITVASSPRFISDGKRWPGIEPNTLISFQRQLNKDYQRTIERFLTLQTLGVPSSLSDARILKNIVLSQPIPQVEVLASSLDILYHIDLRNDMDVLTVPLFRIYGDLDGLVPRKTADILDKRWPQSHSLVIEKAAHAPFISHPHLFCEKVTNFARSV